LKHRRSNEHNSEALGSPSQQRSVRVRYDQSAKLEGFRVNAPKFY